MSTPDPGAERLTDEEVADRAREVGITSRKLLALEVQAHRAFWARVEACDEEFMREVWCAGALLVYGHKYATEPDDQDLDDLRPIFPALLAVKAASEAQS